MNTSIPYWRLSAFYLFYFAVLGALTPYWSPYLEELGFSAAAIGELMAILMATRIAAPLLAGWLADRGGAGHRVVRGACWMAALAFAGTLLGSSFAWLALVMALFGFGWAAALPPFEALTLRHLESDPQRYGSIRLWGSLGFIAAVVVLGAVLERWGYSALVPLSLGLFLALALTSSALPAAGVQGGGGEAGGFRAALRQPAVIALLAIALLMQASHGPYYVFFSIHLADCGYSPGQIGPLWALGVIAEIAVFLAQRRIFARVRVENLLVLALALTALRWVLIGLWTPILAVLLAAQLLHAASFGLFHAVMIHHMNRLFKGAAKARGMALYSSLSFGAGGVLGSLASGYCWSAIGARDTFLGAALLAVAGLVIALRLRAVARGAAAPPPTG